MNATTNTQASKSYFAEFVNDPLRRSYEAKKHEILSSVAILMTIHTSISRVGNHNRQIDVIDIFLKEKMEIVGKAAEYILTPRREQAAPENFWSAPEILAYDEFCVAAHNFFSVDKGGATKLWQMKNDPIVSTAGRVMYETQVMVISCSQISEQIKSLVEKLPTSSERETLIMRPYIEVLQITESMQEMDKNSAAYIALNNARFTKLGDIIKNAQQMKSNIERALEEKKSQNKNFVTE